MSSPGRGAEGLTDAGLDKKLAMFSQLFFGYPVTLHDTVNVDGDVVKAVAFKKVSNALRFAMALQTGLLCAEWPHQPDDIYSPDGGSLLYRGPAVAAAVHFSASAGVDFAAVQPPAGGSPSAISYAGRCVAEALALSDHAQNGQILVSGEAWVQVQFSLGEYRRPAGEGRRTDQEKKANSACRTSWTSGSIGSRASASPSSCRSCPST